MNNKILVTAIVSVTALGHIGSAMAGDWFVGLEAGKARNEVTAERDDLKASDKVKHTDLGFRVGKYLNDNVRTYATITSGKDDWGGNVGKFTMRDQNLMFSADYLFGSGDLKPFIGATVGANRTKIDTPYDNKYEKSFAYGAQAGLVYNLGNFDIEGGYRYLKHDSTFKIREAGNLKIKNKDTQKIYVSASYRF